MKKLISLAFLCLLITKSYASDSVEYFNKETLESCYSKPMSAAVQNCMIYVSDKKNKEYEKEYKDLIAKIISSKNLFHNYNEFISSMKKAKKNWDAYIKNECLAQASLNEKESFSYYIDNNVCLIKGYEERIKYYKEYQY